MKKLIAAFLALSLALGAWSLRAHTVDQKAVASYVAERTVLIRPTNPDIVQYCSGVVVGEDWVLTARHCTDIIEPKVVRRDGTESTVLFSYWPDDGRDIALMRAPGIGCPCADMTDAQPQQWEDVVTSGHPYGMGPVVTFGAVQGKANYPTDYLPLQEFLFCVLNIDVGNSGGGVYVIRGDEIYLVGVVSMGPSSGNTALVTLLL